MPNDFYHVLLSGRCAHCHREVSAPYGELRVTGVFGCICGALTRSGKAELEASTPFAGAGWQAAERDEE